MNLVFFLTIGALVSIILGEFGQFPFGTISASVSLLDIFTTLSLMFVLIWQIAIKKDFSLPLIYKFLVAFYLVATISLFFSQNISGGLYLIRFMLLSSGLLIGFYICRSKVVTLEKLLSVILTIGMGYVLIGGIQFALFPKMDFLVSYGFDPHQFRLFGSFLDPNFSGTFLNIIFLISLYKFFSTREKKFLIMTLFILIALLLTLSRSAYLMLLTEILIIGIFKYRYLIALGIGILIILYFFVPVFAERVNGGISIDKSAAERFESWDKAKIIIQDNLIFGVGFNNLRDAYEKYNLFKVYSPQGGNAGAGVDSSFLFVAATTGVVGLIVYFLFWTKVFIDLFLNFLRKKNILSLFLIAFTFGIFVNSQFINSLFYPSILFLYSVLIGAKYGDNS